VETNSAAARESPISNHKSPIPVAVPLVLVLITVSTVWLFVVRPFWFPSAVAANTAVLDHQFSIALLLLGALFVAGQLVLAVLVLRGRSRRSAAYSQGSWRFEITWTFLIATLFFWFNIAGARVWSEIKIHHAATDSIQVEVTGVQFQWYFRYPGPDATWGHVDAQKFARANEGNPLGIDPDDPAARDDIVSASLVLPVNHDIDLTLRSQDVIHSVFIPAMRFKQDAVPGMDIHAHLRPLQTGTFEIACSQLCGLGHYRMRAAVKIVSDEEFKQWLKGHETKAVAHDF